MSSSKTKKVKQFKHDKKSLWSQFDKEILDETLECVYSSTDRDVCDCCAGSLLVTDEGFKTCTNKKCGILYTDSLDQSAEWRYYGAEDSSSSDPTRCGMPINPLLQESSFGCKVIISGS